MSQGWTCPRCGRHFTRPTKEHSCDIAPLEWHLGKTSPAVRAAFETLEVRLDALGPYRLVPLKSMVTLSARTNFGSLTFGKAFLDLVLMLPEPLDHPRIRQMQRYSAHAWMNKVRLTSPEDVDGEIEAWLRAAYEAQGA